MSVMEIMSEHSPKKLLSSEISEIIELDDSVTVGYNTTPDVICLDDSANRSVVNVSLDNPPEFHRVRAEVDLTNELTRIKDYSNTCVTVPSTTFQIKRKAENENEAPRSGKFMKGSCSPAACDETVTIEDDIFIDCDSSNPLTTKSAPKNLEVKAQASTSSNNFNGINPVCDPTTSYALSVAAACIASLSEKLKPTTRFTPYQSLLKGCAVTNDLLTTGATTNLVVDQEVKKKNKRNRGQHRNAENNLNDSDCILIESDSENSSNCEGSPSSTKTSDLNSNEFASNLKISLSEAPSNDIFISSEKHSKISSHSKSSSCDSSNSILKLDKIPLCSSKKSKNHDKDVVVIDGNELQQEKSDALNIGKNVCLPTENVNWKGLRPVIIDGSNVAFSHGLSTLGERKFSCKGIEICVNYFKDRGHKVIAFVPLFRKSNPYTIQSEILGKLAEQGHITFTPSRRVNAKLSVPYDDRYIVQCAVALGGVIVSSDNYRDLLEENEAWRSTIENRLLMFTFIGDMLMFPQDPLGRSGPNLDEFLRFPEE